MPTTANELLGYPADARLLIINADDFGMYHAITDGILRSIKNGVVHSTSVMVPCPWGQYALRLLAENPEISFGVHLTLVSDFRDYRWGPVASRERVPTLVDQPAAFIETNQPRRMSQGSHLMRSKSSSAHKSKLCWPPAYTRRISIGIASETAAARISLI